MRFEIRTWGGIGDVLLMTPALRAIRCAYPEADVRVHCLGAVHLDVLRHNPRIDRLTLMSRASHAAVELSRLWSLVAKECLPDWLARRAPRRPVRRLCPAYIDSAPGARGQHVTELIGDLMGVPVVDRTLEVWLTDQELERARHAMSGYADPVIVHVRSRCNPNQDWPLAKWHRLVRENPDVTFVQVGGREDPCVEGAVDLRGRTSVREAFGLLKYAQAFVGVVSSMAHASNAVGTPAVVLFGPSPAAVWGHANVLPVERAVRCVPCVDTLFSAPCPYGAPCLRDIEVEDVRTALVQARSRTWHTEGSVPGRASARGVEILGGG